MRDVWPVAFRYESPSLFRRSACLGEYAAAWPKTEDDTPGRILIIQPGHIGDVIQSIPPLRALRKKYPDTKIDFLVGLWNEALASRIPHVDRVIPWKSGMRQYARGNPEYGWTKHEELEALKKLRKCNYQKVYLLGGVSLMTLPILRAITPVDLRVFGKEEESTYTDVAADYIPFDSRVHHMDRLFDLLEIEEENRNDSPESLLTEREQRQVPVRVQEFTALPAPRIVIAAGAGWEGKRWPEEKFGTLIQRLHDERKASIALTGSEAEYELHNRIKNIANVRCVNLAGKTNLIECIQLLRHCDLLISNDNGTLHMASTEKIPTLALYGPTDPDQWGARGTVHHQIRGVRCSTTCTPWHPDATCTRDRECMNAISVDEVFEEVCRILLVKGQ